MGKSIVITSGKSGVGKSTVTVYLGIALCQSGKRVLLMDMDEGLRSLDLMLDVSSHTVFDVSDILSGRCNANQAVLPVPHCTNLFLLPAPAQVGAVQNTGMLARLCRKFAEYFDFVLIDSPAGVGPGFSSAIAAADMALVVVNPDPVSVRDGSYVAALLKKQQTQEIRLVINKLNTRMMRNGTFLNIDEIIDTTGVQLIAAIPTDEQIVHASAAGKPLSPSYAKESFLRLAHRLCGEDIPLPDNLMKIT